MLTVSAPPPKLVHEAEHLHSPDETARLDDARRDATSGRLMGAAEALLVLSAATLVALVLALMIAL